MTAVTTREIGPEICDALGLPADRVSSVELKFHAGEVVTAIVQIWPERDHLDAVMTVLRRYELHEKPSEATAANG